MIIFFLIKEIEIERERYASYSFNKVLLQIKDIYFGIQSKKYLREAHKIHKNACST